MAAEKAAEQQKADNAAEVDRLKQEIECERTLKMAAEKAVEKQKADNAAEVDRLT